MDGNVISFRAKPYGDAEIRACLDKVSWFGVDPIKSMAAMEFGHYLDPKKFANAEDFVAAIVKAVEHRFSP